MESNRITIIHLVVTTGLLVLLEWAGRQAGLFWSWPDYVLLGLVRILEALAVGIYFTIFGPGLKTLGLGAEHLTAGLKTGLFWAAGFGVAAALVLALAAVLGQNLLPLFRMPFPSDKTVLVSFLLVGCLVGPMTEEIVFRGVLFGFLRPFGRWTAMILSTGLFALPHLSHGAFPTVQSAVGGLVFAAAFEKSKHLAAPLIIHIAGNAAIFGLGLWQCP